jgi:prophage antirepressor-like protein
MNSTALKIVENLPQKQELFNFEGQKIRTSIQNDGIWFVATDVCKVLGLTNITESLRRLYENEKNSIRNSEVNRGNPNLTIISESGLYKLILRSSKSEAIKFQDWVTSEVLPSIRKQGGYINPMDSRDPIDIADNLLQIAKEQRIKIEQQQAHIEALQVM